MAAFFRGLLLSQWPYADVFRPQKVFRWYRDAAGKPSRLQNLQQHVWVSSRSKGGGGTHIKDPSSWVSFPRSPVEDSWNLGSRDKQSVVLVVVVVLLLLCLESPNSVDHSQFCWTDLHNSEWCQVFPSCNRSGPCFVRGDFPRHHVISLSQLVDLKRSRGWFENMIPIDLGIYIYIYGFIYRYNTFLLIALHHIFTTKQLPYLLYPKSEDDFPWSMFFLPGLLLCAHFTFMLPTYWLPIMMMHLCSEWMAVAPLSPLEVGTQILFRIKWFETFLTTKDVHHVNQL